MMLLMPPQYSNVKQKELRRERLEKRDRKGEAMLLLVAKALLSSFLLVYWTWM